MHLYGNWVLIFSIYLGILSIILIFTLRVLYVLFVVHTSDCKLENSSSLRTILCMGSGGHTAELLRLINNIDLSKYEPRLYVVARTDLHSETKIKITETKHTNSVYTIAKIPRSRTVNQSYFTSIVSTLWATCYSIPVIYQFKPNLILCNGPGTCVPICVIVFVLRCLYLIDCRIVFIESVCRVNTLSLTGQILQYFADVVVVQWPQLKNVCKRSQYFGRLA